MAYPVSEKRLKGLITFLFLSIFLVIPYFAQAQAHEYKIGNLVIDHPWSRATPAGAKVAGGYMVIRNNSDTEDRLVSVATNIAQKPEIHEMAVQDNVMKMRMLENGLIIPSKGEVTLKPGSYHLMFMKLQQQLKEGDEFSATLTFEKAGKIDVRFNVEAMGQSHNKDEKPAHNPHSNH
ncbi:copper chaperone PCu(A)C [Microvirga sp. W0021]|uniref:Copper chaperone PCu(A)C n=1 Tax=Hohaiivirga grylli TaxID=3133970 RepID=A0ABV0BKH1_9HYPH